MLIRIRQERRRPLQSGGFRYGTTIDLTPRGSPEKRIYRFVPLDPKNPERDHVCDVTDRADIAKLLADPGQFEIHESVETTRTRAAPAATDTEGNIKQPPPQPPVPAASGNGTAQDYSKMSRDELLDVVAKKTGKKPSPATAKKKLLQLLAAA